MTYQEKTFRVKVYSVYLLLTVTLCGCSSSHISTNNSIAQDESIKEKVGIDATGIVPGKWLVQPINLKTDLRKVYFIDNEKGWIIGNSGVILHTTDGGKIWIEQNSGTNVDLFDVWFSDKNRGIIVGGDFTDRTPYTISLYTDDGGKSWHKGEEKSQVGFWNLFFLNSENGWRVGFDEKSKGFLERTSNGGFSWDSTNTQSGEKITNDVSFIDANEGWGIGDFTISHTTDGGMTWELQFEAKNETDIFYRFRRIHFLNNMVGWADGSNDGDTGYLTGIVRTTDGGKTWKESRAPHPLSKLYFFTSLIGIGVGDSVSQNIKDEIKDQYKRDGIIMSTQDGGETWKEMHRVKNSRLNDVFFTREGYGWAVGDNGTLLRYVF